MLCREAECLQADSVHDELPTGGRARQELVPAQLLGEGIPKHLFDVEDLVVDLEHLTGRVGHLSDYTIRRVAMGRRARR